MSHIPNTTQSTKAFLQSFEVLDHDEVEKFKARADVEAQRANAEANAEELEMRLLKEIEDLKTRLDQLEGLLGCTLPHDYVTVPASVSAKYPLAL